MPLVTIHRESGPHDASLFRARTNGHQALGRTAGEALDGLSEYIRTMPGATIVLVQSIGPDQYFSADQIARLMDLTNRNKLAHDGGAPLTPAEQRELESLVEAELDASAKRSAALADQLSR